MPLLHIRVSTRSRERGQGHYSTYFFQMYIILIPEKEKKCFSLFHFFFLKKYLTIKSTLSNGWLTVYQFYSFVQNIYMTESFHMKCLYQDRKFDPIHVI
jgi:hypothetical protein